MCSFGLSMKAVCALCPAHERGMNRRCEDRGFSRGATKESAGQRADKAAKTRRKGSAKTTAHGLRGQYALGVLAMKLCRHFPDRLKGFCHTIRIRQRHVRCATSFVSVAAKGNAACSKEKKTYTRLSPLPAGGPVLSWCLLTSPQKKPMVPHSLPTFLDAWSLVRGSAPPARASSVVPDKLGLDCEHMLLHS